MKRKGVAVRHSDHSVELPRLRKIVGQLTGTEKMIIEGRPCVEILQQVRASYSAVKALEIAILKQHLNNCIANSPKTESKAVFNQRLKDLLDMIKGQIEWKVIITNIKSIIKTSQQVPVR